MGCVSSKNLDDNEVSSRGFSVKSKPGSGGFNNKISEKDSKGFVGDTLKYPMPANEYDGDRFALQHYLFRYIWQSNFSSPIEEKLSTDGTRVLDVGIGTGSWVLEMAKEYPNTKFTGVDHRSLFNKNTPSNVDVKHTDSILSLPFDDNTFDFVFMRFLAQEITEEKFEHILIPELTRVLKPGGYLEIMDLDAQCGNEGPAAQTLMSAVRTHYQSKGINPIMTSKLKRFMSSTKMLVDINVEEEIHPLGSWDEKIGEIALTDWLMVLNNLKMGIAPLLNINEDEYRDLLRSFKDETDIFQTYWASTRVYGKKTSAPDSQPS
ncbi:2248_t:CDS:2 [Acaulospora morrowiae]|uniref:2248_t:CDS:1 n=1 Tax=Acaulospora morrowiae TaxID=94023 RepID=A0A9N9CQ49_9GLOM|nr:2248_t:CDS:2 [Acaulospora morrowiae]